MKPEFENLINKISNLEAKIEVNNQKIELSKLKTKIEEQNSKLDEYKEKIEEKLKKLNSTNRKWINPVNATIIVALIGIFGGLIGNILQGQYSTNQKQLEAEHNLILSLIKVESIEQSKKNLNFFAKAGFIGDETRKQNLLNLIEDSTALPSLKNIQDVAKSIKESLTIEYPKDKASVKEIPFEIGGTFKGKFPENHRLWILTKYKNNDVFFPTTPDATFTSSGKWFHNNVNINPEAKGIHKILVCLSNTKGSEWLQSQLDQDNFGGFKYFDQKGLWIIDYISLSNK